MLVHVDLLINTCRLSDLSRSQIDSHSHFFICIIQLVQINHNLNSVFQLFLSPKVRSLEGLISVAAFGTLILANNDLDWNELQKIRHVHVLDLCLHGNHKLEMDAYCES